MNNNNAPAAIRSLIIFAACIALAVCIGYLLAMPADRGTFGFGGILLLIFLTPILLRWHHFLLIAGWNFSMTIFFLPGTPPVWLLLTAISLGISILHRTINSRAQFLHAPEITWPILFFLAVILFTAKMTGGIGLHSFGNATSGGKKYVTILFGIVAYFALTAQRIPAARVKLYIALFFLAGFSRAIGDLAAYLPRGFNFIFAFFPPSGYNMESSIGSMNFNARYAGLGALGSAGVFMMLACYGVRGILLTGKPWRWVLFGLFIFCVPLGGFRSGVLGVVLVFTCLFFLERVYRTTLMPVFIFAGLIAVTLLIPFSEKLPFNFQRSLSFLPIKISTAARMDADASKEWRLELWRQAYPLVPEYLLLGRGYRISAGDLEQSTNPIFQAGKEREAQIISGDFHSGPLSVIIPFGIWGVIAVLWLWIAGLRALYLNFRYGDPSFRVFNTFLLASFISSIVMFLFIFGGIEGDLANYVSILGLSISINGGIRRPVPVTQTSMAVPAAPPRPRFQPFLQR
ncbi:MAG: O-antigen ligase family protein [Limisphaerales bacterium]